MKLGDVILLMGVLIGISLLVRYYEGATAIIGTTGAVTSRLVRDLQVR